MWSPNVLEWLKLIATVCTPVAIAFSGIQINSTIQKQNATAQRQSSWLNTWADEFLKVSASFNDAATNFVLTYWQLAFSEYSSGNEDGLNLAIKSHYFGLQRSQWEIHKYTDWATNSGPALDEAAAVLVREAETWGRNKGGDVQAFRRAQLAFNRSARKVHAELLALSLRKSEKMTDGAEQRWTR